MERIGIRELKQHTSTYVKKAQEGSPVLVTVYGHLAAQLVPASEADDPAADLVEAGILLPPEEPGDIIDLPTAHPTPGRSSVSEALSQMRDEERW